MSLMKRQTQYPANSNAGFEYMLIRDWCRNEIGARMYVSA
jgi:hypothetical protein